jgi:hypothetical protein
MARTAVQVRLVLDHKGDELPTGVDRWLARELEGESLWSETWNDAHLGSATTVIDEVTDVRVLGDPDEYARSIEVQSVKEPVLASLDEPELGPFVRDSSTSRRAALDNYPRQGTQRWRIIYALSHRSMTRDELRRELGLSHQSIGPRVLELIQGGWVCETEMERETETGSRAKVVALDQKAREELTRREGRV